MKRFEPPSEDPLTALQTRIGHQFRDAAVLRQALTHASALARAAASYERLEFVGDRVLGLAIASMLYKTYPDAPEGELAHRYNALVRRETCAQIAIELGIDAALTVSPQEAQSGGRRKTAILADACEAVLAAVFLDGGFEASAALIEREWSPLMRQSRLPGRDPKTLLQEWLQARGFEPPAYVEVERSGPDHAPVFTIRVSGDGIEPAEGSGKSKRDAEQTAARVVLVRAGLDDELTEPAE